MLLLEEWCWKALDDDDGSGGGGGGEGWKNQKRGYDLRPMFPQNKAIASMKRTLVMTNSTYRQPMRMKAGWTVPMRAVAPAEGCKKPVAF